MVQTKKMNEAFFAKLIKDFNVAGELIRARQDEKQGLLDQFTAESKRFFFGKISEKALASSVKKANKELSRLDADIRKIITHARALGERAKKLSSDQAPITYKATLAGIISAGGKKKKRARKKAKPKTKKKVVKRKAKKKVRLPRKVKKKELALDKKLQKKLKKK